MKNNWRKWLSAALIVLLLITSVGLENCVKTQAASTAGWGDITTADRKAAGYKKTADVPKTLWVAGVKDVNYTGKAITFASMHVYYGTKLLKAGKNYTAKYSNNINAGTASVTVTGIGKYKGSVTKKFKIKRISIAKATAPDIILEYNGKIQKGKTTVTYKLNGKRVTLKQGTDYSLSYTDKTKGAYKAVSDTPYLVTIVGKGNYSGKLTFHETITKRTVITKPTVTPTATPTPTAAPAATPTPTPTPTAAPVPTGVQTESIKSVYSEHGIYTGTCLSEAMIINADYADTITAQFNSVTLENHLKPDAILSREKSIASGQLTVDISGTTVKLLDWAKANGMKMRGHTLIWHSQTPDWIFYEDFDTSKKYVSREVMLQRMESYMKQVFEFLKKNDYIDMFYAYDVVNEAWMEDGSLRKESIWYQIIGEDYLWWAFYYADKYAPESVALYYNDYNEQYKTDCLYNFYQTLVDKNGRSLIDGVGFQAHLYTQDSIENYLRMAEKIGSLGLKVSITELDVSLGNYLNVGQATESNLREQGKYYYDLITGLFALQDAGKINLEGITFWGFTDALSWRKDASPLLYDLKNQKKYAYYGAILDEKRAGVK